MKRKRCTKCGKRKPADTKHFCRCKKAKDGLRWDCKACTKQSCNLYNKNHKIQRRKQQNAWRKKNRKYVLKYIEEYGSNSWELDALDPRMISQLINDQVALRTEPKKQKLIIKKQEMARAKLQKLSDTWKD